MKKLSLLLFSICFSVILYAQNNKPLTKEISGKITFNESPLSNVKIYVLNSTNIIRSDSQGNYSLNTKIGNIITFSYAGFNTVSILIEDVTSVLNIEMTSEATELSEVVVTAAKKNKKYFRNIDRKDERIQTTNGKFNPMLNTKVRYFDQSSIQTQYKRLSDALKLYYPKGWDPDILFDVDGVIFYGEPFIDVSTITDIYVIEEQSNSRLNQPSIIIRTTNSTEYKEHIAEQYRNQNYYNDDAIVTNNDASFSSKTITIANAETITKTIHGTVTYIDAPLANVNIIVVGKTTGTKTNTRGAYTIKAAVGDILQYSHVGFATVSIIVEDVTEILDIEITKKVNVLNEVVVTAKTNTVGKVLERAKKAEEKFETAMGIVNPKSSGFSTGYISGDEIKPVYSSLSEALNGKVAGVRIIFDPIANTRRLILKPDSSLNNVPPPLWDVDGQIFSEEPPIDLNNIKDIHILKTTNRYGSLGAGGVIVVTTKYGSFDVNEAKRKEITEQYTNKNYYSNDASLVNMERLNANTYADALEAFNNKQKAFIYYDQTLKTKVKSYSDHISIAQKFITFYKDANLSKQVLHDLAIANPNNAEILKAIAYQFQALGLKRETIKTYEIIFKLRPKYAQSYRDLANAYLENNQFKKAWRMYMSYLLQGNDVSGEGTGELLYNEMEFLYYSRRHQTNIKEKFIPKSGNLYEFRNDVRLVFEWNTSEAEFDLEFVNQDKRVYVFEHSLAENQELITDEKEKGYSSKEFFIDDIGEGEWLVNITYKGNKKPEPTYFKVTKYYNWGKAKQTQEITVYKFKNQREKLQLMKLNKQVLVASN